MLPSFRRGLPLARRALVAALLCSLGANATPGSAPHAPRGNVIPVYNCNDDGEGSLRHAITLAASGDTVDMVGLSCSKITLGSGLDIGLDDLTLLGAGPDALEITNGAKYGRVLTHTGHGTLGLRGLTISSGTVAPTSPEAGTKGGCIYSAASVALGNLIAPSDRSEGVDVRDCVAISTASGVRAEGGGIYAYGSLALAASRVSGADAVAQNEATSAEGGGISLFGGDLIVKYSEISDCAASGPSGIGGGLEAGFVASITISHSTIADNTASGRAGGAYLGTTNGGELSIDNSTISGNVSGGESGFIVNTMSAAPFGPITIASTTVTANESSLGYTAALVSGPLTLDASLFSGNVGGADLVLTAQTTATGSDNLAGRYSGAVPSEGLVVATDARLAPLANNGGLTRTHSLFADSPAIDAGNDAFASDTDQRGAARTLGSRADIGAVERDPDRIFLGTFD